MMVMLMMMVLMMRMMMMMVMLIIICMSAPLPVKRTDFQGFCLWQHSCGSQVGNFSGTLHAGKDIF